MGGRSIRYKARVKNELRQEVHYNFVRVQEAFTESFGQPGIGGPIEALETCAYIKARDSGILQEWGDTIYSAASDTYQIILTIHQHRNLGHSIRVSKQGNGTMTVLVYPHRQQTEEIAGDPDFSLSFGT
ncbi:MAG: hypothetical protein ACLFPU_10000 [Dehalococcoidia bacterium]